MAKKQPRKPDAAELIAVAFYQEGTMDHAIQRRKLAAKIRRALNAAKRPVWKPMSEVPDDGRDVLMRIRGWRPMIAWRNASHWYWHSGRIERTDGQWTELPTPPKARKGASK